MTYEELKQKRDALAAETAAYMAEQEKLMAEAEAELKSEAEKAFIVIANELFASLHTISYPAFDYSETTEDGYSLRITKKSVKAVKAVKAEGETRISTKGKVHVTAKDGTTEVFDSGKAACDKYGLAYGAGSAPALLRKKGYTVDYIIEGAPTAPTA
jgi:aspartyl-tRNA synthetase